MPGAGKTIAQFLKGKKGTVRVAGISLAGALAPAVALYLQDNSMLLTPGRCVPHPRKVIGAPFGCGKIAQGEQ
jgi:hypothetical protein